MQRKTWKLWWIGWSLVWVGCGDGLPPRVPISGQVLIDGKPLESGFIQVQPSNARPATGKIGSDGRFTLTTMSDNDGCVLGTHLVTVIANKSEGPYAMRWFAPKKYADMTTSDLKLEVTEPRDDVVIRLNWEGGKPFVERFEKEGDVLPPQVPARATE